MDCRARTTYWKTEKPTRPNESSARAIAVSAVWCGRVLPWPSSRAIAGLASRNRATEAGIIMASTERRPEPNRATKASSSCVE